MYVLTCVLLSCVPRHHSYVSVLSVLDEALVGLKMGSCVYRKGQGDEKDKGPLPHLHNLCSRALLLYGFSDYCYSDYCIRFHVVGNILASYLQSLF